MATSMATSSVVIFRPDKYECIAVLISKLVGRPLACFESGDVLQDLDPYDENKLPCIFKAAQEKDLYFFAKLKRKGESGLKNVDRTAGKGAWHGEQTSNVTYDIEGVKQVVGTEHTFTYKEEGSEHDDGYLLTEYRLMEDRRLEYDLFKHGVFCVLRFISGL